MISTNSTPAFEAQLARIEAMCCEIPDEEIAEVAHWTPLTPTSSIRDFGEYSIAELVRLCEHVGASFREIFCGQEAGVA